MFFYFRNGILKYMTNHILYATDKNYCELCAVSLYSLLANFSGKAVSGVATHASKQNVPVIVVTGRNRTGQQSIPEIGITAIHETAKSDDFEEIKRTCRTDLAETMKKILL